VERVMIRKSRLERLVGINLPVASYLVRSRSDLAKKTSALLEVQHNCPDPFGIVMLYFLVRKIKKELRIQ
jgi:hypothetical protein